MRLNESVRCCAAVALCLSAGQTLAGGAPDAVTDCLASAGYDRAAGEACLGLLASPCIDALPTPAPVDVAQCIEAETAVWDTALNAAYGDLIAAAQAMDGDGGETPDGQEEALRAAQRAWIAFRDADCAWRGNLTFGTGHFTDGAECAQRLTAARVLDLIQYGGAP